MTIEKFETLKPKLSRALKEHFLSESEVPGEQPVELEVHVPHNQLVLSDEEEFAGYATVTSVVRCPSEKKHTVYIKFNFDKTGKLVKDSITYV